MSKRIVISVPDRIWAMQKVNGRREGFLNLDLDDTIRNRVARALADVLGSRVSLKDVEDLVVAVERSLRNVGVTVYSDPEPIEVIPWTSS